MRGVVVIKGEEICYVHHGAKRQHSVILYIKYNMTATVSTISVEELLISPAASRSTHNDSDRIRLIVPRYIEVYTGVNRMDEYKVNINVSVITLSTGRRRAEVSVEIFQITKSQEYIDFGRRPYLTTRETSVSDKYQYVYEPNWFERTFLPTRTFENKIKKRVARFVKEAHAEIKHLENTKSLQKAMKEFADGLLNRTP